MVSRRAAAASTLEREPSQPLAAEGERAPAGANAPAEQVLDPVEAQRRECHRILDELAAEGVAEAREVLEAMQEFYADRTPAPPSGTRSLGTFVAERVEQRVRPEFSADPDEF